MLTKFVLEVALEVDQQVVPVTQGNGLTKLHVDAPHQAFPCIH